MSQELVKSMEAPLALTMSEEEQRETMAAFVENCGDGSISEFTLPRIKVANGMAQWLVEDVLEGEKPVPYIEGVIVYIHDSRTYYPTKNAGNVPPECSSRDGVTGYGKPGGKCKECPLAQWDSAEGESNAQACKQSKELFMLIGDSVLPTRVSLPPTSLKAVEKFKLQMVTKRMQYRHCIVRLSLVKAQNKAGQTYGKAVFDVVRRLSEAEAKRSEDMQGFTKAILARQEQK